MTTVPTFWFFLLKYTNEYLVVILITIIAYTIYRFDRRRLLDFFVSLLLAISFSEGIKYIFDLPRPVPLLGLTFEGGSFPSTHTAAAFNVFFFYLFCTKFNMERAYNLKRIIAQSLPFLKSLNVIERGEAHISRNNRFYNTVLIVGFLLLAIIVAILRIVTGAHYLIDVIAGIIIGFVFCVPFVYYDITRRRI